MMLGRAFAATLPLPPWQDTVLMCGPQLLFSIAKKAASSLRLPTRGQANISVASNFEEPESRWLAASLQCISKAHSLRERLRHH